MRKYMLRYLIFWLPAAIVAYLFNRADMISQIAQWATALFMLFGWSANTGMAAYHYPRNTLALILAYLGGSILLIMSMYAVPYSSTPHFWLNTLGGLLSFRPLGIFVKALLDFNIRQELVVTCALSACCMAGYLVGLIVRRIRPNPYRPRFGRG